MAVRDTAVEDTRHHLREVKCPQRGPERNNQFLSFLFRAFPFAYVLYNIVMQILALIKRVHSLVPQSLKKPFLFFGAFVFLFLIFFPKSAFAQAGLLVPIFGWVAGLLGASEVIDVLKGIWTVLGNLNATLFFAFLISLVTGTLNFVYGLLTAIAAGITIFLVWIIEVTLSVPVVPNRDFSVVTRGWEFTRDLTNMLFILILAVIGMATILRIQSYQLQRLLPTLIIVALLINFSGVLVGLVVDIADILTVVFLENLKDTLVNLTFFQLGFADKGDDLWSTFKCEAVGIGSGCAGAEPQEYITVLIGGILQVLVLSVFYFMLILLLIVIALVFVIRIGVLWALSILAPFAFVAYILPATRGMWNRWLSTLIQWAFVGVPLAFFLWLAAFIAGESTKIDELFKTATAPGVPVPAGVPAGVFRDALQFLAELFRTLLVQLITPFLSILFLFIGLMLSFGLTGKMGNAVLKFAGRTAAVTAGVLARDAIRSGLAKSGKAQKLTQRMEGYSSRDRKGMFHNTLGRMAAPAIRWTGRKAGSENVTSMGKRIDEAETAAKDMEATEMGSRFKGNSLDNKVGIVNAAIKNKKIDDLLDKNKGGVTETEIAEVYKHARLAERHKEIDAALPTLRNAEMRQRAINKRVTAGAPPFSSLSARRQQELVAEQFNEEIFKKIEGDRTERISKKIFETDPTAIHAASGTPQFKNAAAMEAMVRNFNRQRMANVLRTHHDDAPPAIENAIRQLSAGRALSAQDIKERDFQVARNTDISHDEATRNVMAKSWLQENNPALLKYLRTNESQGLNKLNFDFSKPD